MVVGLPAGVTWSRGARLRDLPAQEPEQCWQAEQPGRKSSAFKELKTASGQVDRKESVTGSLWSWGVTGMSSR